MLRIINDLVDILEFVYYGLEDVFILGVLVIGFFIYLVNLNVILICIVFFFILILVLFIILLRNRMMKVFVEIRVIVGVINVNLFNVIFGICVLKFFNNSKYEFNKFELGNIKYIIVCKVVYLWLVVF